MPVTTRSTQNRRPPWCVNEVKGTGCPSLLGFITTLHSFTGLAAQAFALAPSCYVDDVDAIHMQEADESAFDGMPDPHAVLDAALQDTRVGAYDQALAKYEWVHKESLRINPHFHGVRLSFAMSGWYDLAKQYPPAMQRMKDWRDAAEAGMKEETGSWKLFQDVVAFNQTLEEPERTVAVFKWLDANRPDMARRVYHSALRDLVSLGEIGVCGAYIDPRDVDLQLKGYEATVRIANLPGRETKSELLEFADSHLAYDAGILLALLVKHERVDEALEVAKRYAAYATSPAVSAAVDAGLRGEFPTPYP